MGPADATGSSCLPKLHVVPSVKFLRKVCSTPCSGEMAEWLKAHAWKACIPQGIQGSNPCLSAIQNQRVTNLLRLMKSVSVSLPRRKNLDVFSLLAGILLSHESFYQLVGRAKRLHCPRSARL